MGVGAFVIGLNQITSLSLGTGNCVIERDQISSLFFYLNNLLSFYSTIHVVSNTVTLHLLVVAIIKRYRSSEYNEHFCYKLDFMS